LDVARSGDPRYHHGDLRRALVDEAVRVLADEGPSALTLRALARRIGVSHAAPTHHFGDKTGLLTAVATQGFELLADALARASEHGDFADVGVGYVSFAVEHPGHFAVMFRTDLHDPHDPGLVAARGRAAGVLRGGARRSFGTEDRAAALAAWSVAHGLAMLVLDGAVELEPGADVSALAGPVMRRLSSR
jgi:AcrR family transcriptional regulator